MAAARQTRPEARAAGWSMVHASWMHFSAAEGGQGKHGRQLSGIPEADPVAPANDQAKADEVDAWIVVPDTVSGWEVVQPPVDGSQVFRVKRHPNLDMGLERGFMYTKANLLNRCQGTPSMMAALMEMLQDPSCEYFEPVPRLQPAAGGYVDSESLATMLAGELQRSGIVAKASSAFTTKAVNLLLLLEQGPSILPKAADVLRQALSYPIDEFVATEAGGLLVQTDVVRETAKRLIFAKDSGALEAFATDPTAVQRIAKALAQARDVETKELWQAIRICLTANPKGLRISLSTLFQALGSAEGNVLVDYVPLDRRVDILRERLGL